MKTRILIGPRGRNTARDSIVGEMLAKARVKNTRRAPTQCRATRRHPARHHS